MGKHRFILSIGLVDAAARVPNWLNVAEHFRPLVEPGQCGFVAIQIVLVCTWQLLTMVKRGTVFSHAAFRYVDVIIGAIVAGALLIFAFGAILAPGEAAPPGFVLLVGGGGAATLGIALVVGVVRMLLAQAVARDVEAAQLQAELAEVI